MTRRFFTNIFASVAAFSTATVARAKQAVFGKAAFKETLNLKPADAAIRQALWLRIQHTDAIRFTVGSPGAEPIASGVIQPMPTFNDGGHFEVHPGPDANEIDSPWKFNRLQPAEYMHEYPLPWRDYGIASVKGLRTDVPLQVTITSRTPFQVIGYQQVFDRPYTVVSEGAYKKPEPPELPSNADLYSGHQGIMDEFDNSKKRSGTFPYPDPNRAKSQISYRADGIRYRQGELGSGDTAAEILSKMTGDTIGPGENFLE